MPKAIFSKHFHWQRPKTGDGKPPVGFGAMPKADPQLFPSDFIAAAVDAGAAKKVGGKAPADDASDDQ